MSLTNLYLVETDKGDFHVAANDIKDALLKAEEHLFNKRTPGVGWVIKSASYAGKVINDWERAWNEANQMMKEKGIFI